MSLVTSIESIPVSRASKLLAAHLNGAQSTSDVGANFGLLRSCVWTLSGTSIPAHTLRVLNLAVSVIGFVRDDPELREQLRRSLEELADIGDLICLPGGLWLPGPVREVPLDSTIDERLLIGGLPTSALPASLRRKIVNHGPYRRVKGAALSNALRLPKQSLSSWTGRPDEELDVWSARMLGVDLLPYEPPRDGSRLSFYTPELAAPRATQFNRWYPRAGELSGRYLARRDRLFGVREYRIVELKRGTVVGINDSLAPGDARRLMYGLDARVERATEIPVTVNSETVIVILRSELPQAELRLFGAIGSLEEAEGTYYPRSWRFAKTRLGAVLDALIGVRVRINLKNLRG